VTCSTSSCFRFLLLSGTYLFSCMWTMFQPARAWSKRVQHDWKLLEKDLPG
jgi:hypothetical protein